jgi:IS5 family transposase
VAILNVCQPKDVLVVLGYRGVDVQPGTKVYHPKLKGNITQRLRRDIRPHSAIEPAIGYMKNDGQLRRNRLRGKEGDALHALLCGCDHNLRMILRKLRLLVALFVTRSMLPQCVVGWQCWPWHAKALRF